MIVIKILKNRYFQGLLIISIPLTILLAHSYQKIHDIYSIQIKTTLNDLNRNKANLVQKRLSLTVKSLVALSRQPWVVSISESGEMEEVVARERLAYGRLQKSRQTNSLKNIYMIKFKTKEVIGTNKENLFLDKQLLKRTGSLGVLFNTIMEKVKKSGLYIDSARKDSSSSLFIGVPIKNTKNTTGVLIFELGENYFNKLLTQSEFENGLSFSHIYHIKHSKLTPIDSIRPIVLGTPAFSKLLDSEDRYFIQVGGEGEHALHHSFLTFQFFKKKFLLSTGYFPSTTASTRGNDLAQLGKLFFGLLLFSTILWTILSKLQTKSVGPNLKPTGPSKKEIDQFLEICGEFKLKISEMELSLKKERKASTDEQEKLSQ